MSSCQRAFPGNTLYHPLRNLCTKLPFPCHLLQCDTLQFALTNLLCEIFQQDLRLPLQSAPDPQYRPAVEWLCVALREATSLTEEAALARVS